MTAAQPGAVRQWRCQQVLLRFFHLLDARRYAELVALFEEDGEWLRPGAVMRGRAEIAQAMAQRPVHRSTCHLVSNFLVLQEGGDGSVDAVAHLTTYVFESVAAPAKVSGPAGIFTAQARFRCAAASVGIARLELAPAITLQSA